MTNPTQIQGMQLGITDSNGHLPEKVDRVLCEMQQQQRRAIAEIRSVYASLTGRSEAIQQQNCGSLVGEELVCQYNHYNSETFDKYFWFEIPQFRGKDLKGWLYKCEQYFGVNKIPSSEKVRLVELRLEGQALQWHRIYLKTRLTRELPLWKEYVFALHNRFGVGFNFDCFDNSMDELSTLEQSGSVQNYIHDFDELLKWVDVNEVIAIRYFLRGLSDDVEVQVRMCDPKTLQKAFSLAKTYEQLLHLEIKKQSCIQTPPLLPDFSNSKETFVDRSPNDFQLRAGELVDEVYSSYKGSKLTPTKMNEKQPQGLCCGSHENLGDDNECIKEHLFALTVDANNVEEDDLCKFNEYEVVKKEEPEQETHLQSWNGAKIGLKDYKCVKAVCSVILTDDQHMRQGTNGNEFLEQEEWQWLLANINELNIEPNLFVDGRTKDFCMVLKERHHTYEYHVFKALPAQELEKHQLAFHVSQLKKRIGGTSKFYIYYCPQNSYKLI